MLLTSIAMALVALADQPTGVSLTVYSSADPRGFDPQQFVAQARVGENPTAAWQVPGFGVVRETRSVTLKQGVMDLPFTDVAAFIDPTTVSFTDLTHPSTTVMEQNFQFDLVNASKLYEKYLGRDVTFERGDGKDISVVTGALLSASQGQFVVKTDKGVRVLPAEGTRAVLGELPGGLITKPTLVWKVKSDTAGEHTIRTTYQTAGMTWRADYNLVLNADDTKANLTPWVTLMNVSGAGFHDAQLKLIAGDVQRVQPVVPRTRAMRSLEASDMSGAPEGFAEESLFEYHLYTLPRPTDVLANTTQQLALFPPVNDVPVVKELVYQGTTNLWEYSGGVLQEREVGAESNRKVGVFVRFENKESSRLGVPLPKGRVRVYKMSGDSTLEFVGEDLVDHTAKNESVRLKLGDSFDVTAERVATDFKINTGRKEMVETFRITLKNAKNVTQKIEAREYLYRWSNWEITAKSQDFRKLDARSIAFDVEVPPEGSKTVEYTVRYTW